MIYLSSLAALATAKVAREGFLWQQEAAFRLILRNKDNLTVNLKENFEKTESWYEICVNVLKRKGNTAK